jgi:hypothetical protein
MVDTRNGWGKVAPEAAIEAGPGVGTGVELGLAVGATVGVVEGWDVAVAVGFAVGAVVGVDEAVGVLVGVAVGVGVGCDAGLAKYVYATTLPIITAITTIAVMITYVPFIVLPDKKHSRFCYMSLVAIDTIFYIFLTNVCIPSKRKQHKLSVKLSVDTELVACSAFRR